MSRFLPNFLVSLTILGLVRPLLADTAAPTASRGPLSPEAEAVFWGSPEDPPAKELAAIKEEFRDRHFPTCDERNLELFEPHVRDIGGAYVGVGSDQSYLIIGWMRPEVAWLTDYDAWISDLHRVYRAFFLTAADADAFLALWKDRDAGMKAIDEALAGDPRAAHARKAYASARVIVGRRLDWVKRNWGRKGIRSFLTDAETYTFVRTMIQQRRIRPMVGNLLGTRGIAGVSEAARKLGIPIRAFYMSNAEDYWRYPKAFKENILGLHADERSVILRTTATKPSNGDFRYWVQPIDKMKEWMKSPGTRSVANILPWVSEKDRENVTIVVIDRLPPPPRKPRGKR